MGNAMHECIKVFEAALTKLTCLHSESGKGPVGLCRPWIIIVWISPSGVTDLVKLNSSCSVHPDPVINDNGPNYGPNLNPTGVTERSTSQVHSIGAFQAVTSEVGGWETL